MLTLRKAIGLSVVFVFVLLFVSACGAPATTPASAPTQARGSVYEEPIVEEPTYAPAPADTAPAPNQSQAFRATQTAKNEPYDMFFKDYGVNPSIDTDDDHLSTFGLDVDTGSYTIMRNYLSDGNLPPSDSVRVEEYVNFFEQGYPNPPAHQAFGISIDGGPSPFTQTERYQMLRVGIQGYQIDDADRKDAALTFVIDVSGSMDIDNRLGLVKRSLELLVEQLRRTDTVSIVVYGSEARTVLNPTPGSRKGEILSAIYALRTEGATNAEAGLRLGYRTAMQGYMPGGINRVILCSDGVANVGQTGPDAILGEIGHYVEEGVTLTTIGFGMDNYNDTLMEQLADKGNGFYAYIDDMDEARRLFIDEITGTLQTIALNAKVQVDFNRDVVLRYRLVGFENRAVADDQFRDNNVDAGEIGAGHTVTALYEVKLNPDAYGRIATVNMRWEDPDTHGITEISQDFDVSQLAFDFHKASPYFQRAVIVAEYAEILKESYWAKESSIEDVYREAERIREYFDENNVMDEFVDLVRKASRLK
jgi:Ca-activated chloride channel family protein